MASSQDEKYPVGVMASDDRPATRTERPNVRLHDRSFPDPARIGGVSSFHRLDHARPYPRDHHINQARSLVETISSSRLITSKPPLSHATIDENGCSSQTRHWRNKLCAAQALTPQPSQHRCSRWMASWPWASCAARCSLRSWA